MDYPLMNNPYLTFPLCEMKKKQVDLSFLWFMAHKDERVKQLQKFINEETDKVILDYSVESLKPLWEWYENHIEYVPRTPEEIEASVANCPKWIQEIINEDASKETLYVSSNPETLHEIAISYTEKETIMTLALAYDISIYYGETIINNNPHLYWGFPRKTKKLHGVNAPNILGFGSSFNLYVYGILSLLIKRSHKEKDKNRLYNIYITHSKLF